MHVSSAPHLPPPPNQSRARAVGGGVRGASHQPVVSVVHGCGDGVARDGRVQVHDGAAGCGSALHASRQYVGRQPLARRARRHHAGVSPCANPTTSSHAGSHSPPPPFPLLHFPRRSCTTPKVPLSRCTTWTGPHLLPTPRRCFTLELRLVAEGQRMVVVSCRDHRTHCVTRRTVARWSCMPACRCCPCRT